MTTLKVFYDERQTVKNNPSLSPSAAKPALVVDEWKRRGFAIELAPVTPVTRDDFYLVHEKKHVDEILDCKRSNGFHNKSPEVAASLYWTSGSLVSAATFALGSGENTCSPTSGFHHAEWWKCEGFCTFNGLALAAVKLRESLPYDKIGILDLDMHYGNGTDNIILRRGLNYVRHYTFGGAERTSEYWRGGPAADEWIKRLPGIVESFQDCAIVLYQAGADPHFEDPFGGALTDAQLRERDRIVFTTLRKLKVPCVWNLAGGYQTPIQKVLDIHSATVEECLRVMS
jgi:acetoin utilization deacetylase AcuC-like enzyme